MFALVEEGLCRLQGAVEDGGLGAVVRGEVAVARGAGQAVGFAGDGRRDDFDREEEVADHAADDGELLGVFFAEDGDVRLRQEE